MAVAAVVLRSPSRRSAGRSAWATTTIGGPAPPWWWRQSPSNHHRRSSRGGEGSRLSRSTTRAPRVRPAPWCGVALAFRAGAIRTTRTNDKYTHTDQSSAINGGEQTQLGWQSADRAALGVGLVVGPAGEQSRLSQLATQPPPSLAVPHPQNPADEGTRPGTRSLCSRPASSLGAGHERCSRWLGE